MLAHSDWCTHPSPNTGGSCLWSQGTATGKAKLASGGAVSCKASHTAWGASKVNLGAPCCSGNALPLMSCAGVLVPPNDDLGSRYLGTGLCEGLPVMWRGCPMS